jgi:beta-lactamase class A
MSLVDQVGEVLDGQAGLFGVYARNLSTGDTIAVRSDQVFPAESTIKTAILLHYERCVDADAVDPGRRVRLASERRFDGTGVLRYLADDLEPTLNDLAWLMIIVPITVPRPCSLRRWAAPV